MKEYKLFLAGEWVDTQSGKVIDDLNPADGSVYAKVHIAGQAELETAIVKGLDNASYMLREVVVPAGYNKAADTPVTSVTRVDTADGSATEITVQNLKGTELPGTGGIGTVPGIMVGVLVFELLKIVLQFLGVNPYYNYIVQGLVIVIAVAVDIRKNIKKK